MFYFIDMWNRFLIFLIQNVEWVSHQYIFTGGHTVKKALSLGLALSMALGLMAGCAGSPSSSTTSAGTSTSASAEETVITFGIHVANPESHEAVTWQIVQAFNEAYAGKYKVEFQAADTETHTTNMMLQATDGTLPEIFWMDASQAPEYAESGYLLDLSDFLSQNEAVDTALGGMEDAFNNGSMQYGRPISATCRVSSTTRTFLTRLRWLIPPRTPPTTNS